MNTDSLLLRCSMRYARPHDYVEWAVERMCEELDSPSLRILAGLNIRLEQHEIETYFKKSCEELNVDTLAQMAEPRRTAELVRRAYELGELSPDTVVRMMAKLHEESNYCDALLAVWYSIEEELSFSGTEDEGCLYPLAEFDSLKAVCDREWSLFARALRLNLPPGFYSFTQCARCGHIDDRRPKRGTLIAKIMDKLPWLRPDPQRCRTCPHCGCRECSGMSDPQIREAYFKQLEDEQSAAAPG
ncbi:hypothetical protein ACFL34_06020 [Candidatus Sumerlaeota bacterium]